MRIFNLDKIHNIVCNSESTRNGFRHIAVLHRNGFEVARAKVCYLNRTWESYEFETVLKILVDANFEGKQKEKFLEKIKGGF